MSGLLLPGRFNGHRSASQRREEFLRATNEHLLQIIAILAVQQGGLVMIPGDSLRRAYDLNAVRDPHTGNIVYSAKPAAGTVEPLMPTLGEADPLEPPEKEPT